MLSIAVVFWKHRRCNLTSENVFLFLYNVLKDLFHNVGEIAPLASAPLSQIHAWGPKSDPFHWIKFQSCDASVSLSLIIKYERERDRETKKERKSLYEYMSQDITVTHSLPGIKLQNLYVRVWISFHCTTIYCMAASFELIKQYLITEKVHLFLWFSTPEMY